MREINSLNGKPSAFKSTLETKLDNELADPRYQEAVEASAKALSDQIDKDVLDSLPTYEDSPQATEAPLEEVEPAKDIAKRKPGRPPGSKNKDTLFKELMTGSFQSKAIADIEKVYSVLFEKAHKGDMKAIKMVLDRVVPVSKAVDLADMEKGGITVNVSVGALEGVKEDIEDAEYNEVE